MYLMYSISQTYESVHLLYNIVFTNYTVLSVNNNYKVIDCNEASVRQHYKPAKSTPI